MVCYLFTEYVFIFIFLIFYFSYFFFFYFQFRGGKTALAYALHTHSSSHPSSFTPRSLISLDASPASYTHRHSLVFDAIRTIGSPIPKKQLKNKREADTAIRSILNSATDRAFVIENLKEVKTLTSINQLEEEEMELRWRSNVSVLEKSESNVHGFDIHHTQDSSISSSSFPVSSPPLLSYPLPTLFLGGSKSDRLTNPNYTHLIPNYFPNSTIHIIQGAAHFLHSSHSNQTADFIVDFILKNELK
jgi:pimeloyl-ACP methyl ester carboxylesterase